MPENLIIGLFVFGSVLILISLIGGRFKIFSVAILSDISSPFIRILAFVLGMSAMLLALIPNMVSGALVDATATVPPVVPETLQPILPPTLVYLPPTATDTPIPSRADPVEFVISYWRNVSDGNYANAWNQLSPRFRQVMHNNDFNGYVQGFQSMQICRIDVSNPVLIRQDDGSAVVTAHFSYFTGAQCTVNEYDFEMSLVYDTSLNSWWFDKNDVK